MGYSRDYFDWSGLPNKSKVTPDLFNSGYTVDNAPCMQQIIFNHHGDRDGTKQFLLDGMEVSHNAGTTWDATSGTAYFSGVITYIDANTAFDAGVATGYIYLNFDGNLEASANLDVSGCMLGSISGSTFTDLRNGRRDKGGTYTQYNSEHQYFAGNVDIEKNLDVDGDLDLSGYAHITGEFGLSGGTYQQVLSDNGTGLMTFETATNNPTASTLVRRDSDGKADFVEIQGNATIPLKVGNTWFVNNDTEWQWLHGGSSTLAEGETIIVNSTAHNLSAVTVSVSNITIQGTRSDCTSGETTYPISIITGDYVTVRDMNLITKYAATSEFNTQIAFAGDYISVINCNFYYYGYYNSLASYNFISGTGSNLKVIGCNFLLDGERPDSSTAYGSCMSISGTDNIIQNNTYNLLNRGSGTNTLWRSCFVFLSDTCDRTVISGNSGAIQGSSSGTEQIYVVWDFSNNSSNIIVTGNTTEDSQNCDVGTGSGYCMITGNNFRGGTVSSAQSRTNNI